MKEVQIKNLEKEYKLGNKETFKALNNINITFNKGELVSIIGESGSGKSTLMNLIGGLDSDFTGDIVVSGTSLKGLKDKDLDRYRKNKVGFVFQSFNLIPQLSILDNVTIALTLSGISEKERIARATEILKKVGLESQLKKKPNQLSGGQKQRVAIARALINDPDIILADEPTGSLDSDTTLQILDILKQIADEGKLVVMVTHSEKVAKVSSRIVELSDGKIVRDEINKEYKKKRKKLKKETLKKTEKQTLGFWSAIKLAFHNMWASKTKNFLMAFGVSISISSLILMLSFGSGLTGYINTLSKEYSSPTIATISKQSTGDPFSSLSGTPFEEGEIEDLVKELNENVLSESNFTITSKNISYGYMAMTGFTQSASVSFTPEGKDEINSSIFTMYTTPGYYTESNLLEGQISSENEVMFSGAILEKFGDDIVGKDVTVTFKIEGITIIKQAKVTGIVDVAMMNSMLMMYVDYDFLKNLVYQETLNQTGTGYNISPTSVYIETDSQETTLLINDYVKSSEKYTGSIEERLANMFSQMMDTFGIALAMIAGISLLVAAIMILVVLYISVTERTKEIGVLKSIGARKKDIKLIFTSESFLIGVLSGLMGCLLSLILVAIITITLNSLIGMAPISLQWQYMLISFGIAILISMIAGLYPSAKAAKLDPVEALRRE